MKRYVLKIGPSDDGKTLVDVIARIAAISRKKAKTVLDDRNVFVNQRRVWMAKHNVRKGDIVEFPRPEESRQMTTVTVSFEDDLCLAAEKPSGILSTGKGSLEELLRKQTGIPGLLAVHRLDRDTSGILLFAKARKFKDLMIAEFRDRNVGKVYEAIVVGNFPIGKRSITTPFEGKPARTEVFCVSRTELASHLRCSPKTGRTHQIRKHLVAAGHPVLGDKQYGTSKDLPGELRGVRRQMLHAAELSFTHPVSGKTVICRARLPKDFRAALKRLKLA
ncbi:MAG: RluA family pseudouridine synthase [Verrucomicrobia bacterium]|nr:RluA family pseudouridine synthase [Verrucomicrobiota bacterium]